MSSNNEQPKHAKLGASGYKKWATCTMSAATEADIPDEDSEFSAEGTCGHGVAEARISTWLAKQGVDGFKPIDETKVDNYEKYANPEFLAYVQEFVDEVIERVLQAWAEYGKGHTVVLLEQRLDFSRWVPEGFGTGDVVIIVPGKVTVVDLKFGKGVFVSVNGNGQLRLYALGAYEQYHYLYDFEQVEVVIHQPRMSNLGAEVIPVHGPNGLLTWAEEVVVPRARIAWAALNGDYSEARFAPGEHCSQAFCKARFTCAARARYMMQLAEMPFSLEDPDKLTIEQLEEVYDKAAVAVKWASDVKNYLLKSAARGSLELKRYELVEGRSVRVIRDPTEAARILIHNGFKPADVYKEPELVGLTQLEKLVGAKKLSELLGELLHKPAGAPTLAPRGSGREPVQVVRPQVTAQQAFGELD